MVVAVRLAGGPAPSTGNAEIKDLHERRPVGPQSEKQVGRLEVAVHDADRMGFRHGVHGLHQAVDRFFHRQHATRLERLAQVRAAEVFHDHVRKPVIHGSNVHDPHHVRAPKPDQRARLPKKPIDGFGIAERAVSQKLDGHRLPQLHVAGGDNDPHSACAENGLDDEPASDELSRLRNALHARRARRTLGR
jgi:hypothetical protein